MRTFWKCLSNRTDQRWLKSCIKSLNLSVFSLMQKRAQEIWCDFTCRGSVIRKIAVCITNVMFVQNMSIFTETVIDDHLSLTKSSLSHFIETGKAAKEDVISSLVQKPIMTAAYIKNKRKAKPVSGPVFKTRQLVKQFSFLLLFEQTFSSLCYSWYTGSSGQHSLKLLQFQLKQSIKNGG